MEKYSTKTNVLAGLIVFGFVSLLIVSLYFLTSYVFALDLKQGLFVSTLLSAAIYFVIDFKIDLHEINSKVSNIKGELDGVTLDTGGSYSDELYEVWDLDTVPVSRDYKSETDDVSTVGDGGSKPFVKHNKKKKNKKTTEVEHNG